MNHSPLAPMGVGKLLDRSFSVYRQHFGAFFLLTLILFGPFLLLQQLLTADMGNLPLLVQDTGDVPFWEAMGSRFTGSENIVTESIGKLMVFLLLVVPVMTLAVYPQLLSAGTIMTKAAIEGEEVAPKEALKRSLRSFWPLVGSTLVYILIVIGVVLAFFIVSAILFFIVTLVSPSFFDSVFAEGVRDNPILAIFLFIVIYIAFLIALVLVPGFFLLRWAFYLPVVLLEDEGVGIGRSWQLTKGNFWRLLAIYLVVVVLNSVFSGGIQMVTVGTMGFSVITVLIQVLASCLLIPWVIITYALAYLDLKVRKDGTDLTMMLSLQKNEEPQVTASEQGTEHE